MSGLGAAICGGNPMNGRNPHDFYSTPSDAIKSLIPILRKRNWPNYVWEPACGALAITNILKKHGFGVISSDKYPVNDTIAEVDFLGNIESPYAMEYAIITNPPFSLAYRFIQQGLELKSDVHMALLLKATYWNVATRLNLFFKYRPSLVMPLTWRLDFTGGGRPTMDCMWVLWEPNNKNETIFEPLKRVD